MRAAQQDERVGIVRPAVGERLAVVHLDEGSALAARHGAAPAVTPHDRAANLRRDRALHLRGGRRIHAAELVGVAASALEGGLVDDDLVRARALGGRLARVAHRDRDRVRGAALVARLRCTARREIRARQIGDERVVVDRCARVGDHGLARFLRERPRGCGDEVAEAPWRLGLGVVERAVTPALARHHALDLSHRSAARGLEPFALFVLDDDARKLPSRRPVEPALLQRGRELRQRFERLGDADSLARLPSVDAAEALRVLGEAAQPQGLVHANPVRREQPAALLEVETSALTLEGAQPAMDRVPVRHLCQRHEHSFSIDARSYNRFRHLFVSMSSIYMCTHSGTSMNRTAPLRRAAIRALPAPRGAHGRGH